MIRPTVRWRGPRLASPLTAPLPFVSVSAALFLLLCLTLAVPLAPRPARPWKGYSILLIRPGSPAGSRLGALLSSINAAVSADRARVTFTDFEGMSGCTVAELPARLDPADPRRDPWLQGIGGYFHLTDGKGEWEAVYLPADSSPVLRFLHCAAVLGLPWRGEWRLSDFDPARKLLCLLLAAVYSVLVAWAFGLRTRETVRFCGTAAVPWLLWIASGDLAELLFFYFGWIAWICVAREIEDLSRGIHRHAWRDRDRGEFRFLLRLLTVMGGGAGVLYLASGFTVGRLMEMLRLSAGGFTALCLPVLLDWMRKGERDTRFDPVTIVRRRRGMSFSLGIRARSRLPLAVLVLLTPILFACLGLLRMTALPTPHGGGASRSMSWEALQDMAAMTDVQAGLPDIAQYVLHCAYQEGLPFGRARVFPSSGERVQILEYLPLADSPGVVSRLRTVKVYDERWVERTLAAAPPGSLERMLLRQGRPMTVTREKTLPLAPAELPFLTALLLALLAALLWDGELAPLLFARLRIFTVGGRA